VIPGVKDLHGVSARLRALLPDLRGPDLIMVPQEILDLLLALAGRKPVYLMRGFGPPGWAERVVSLARRHKAVAQWGPMWTAANPYEGSPAWLAELAGHSWDNPRGEALYVTMDREIAREVREINAAGGRVTVEQEARLLGYPPCCVEYSYAKHRAFKALLVRACTRIAGGDEVVIRRMIAEDEAITLTDQEQAEMAAITALHMASYTSVNMCPACHEEPDSPARRLSRANEDFAWEVDATLVGMVRRAHDACRQDIRAPVPQ